MKKRSGRARTIREAAAEYAATPDTGEKPVRKNHYLFQSKIDLARQILGAASETEALDGALDMLIYGEALAQGTEAMAGADYNDVLGIAGEIPSGSAGG